jgi:DNA-binding winged helix-turn-helix (wHTH) protein
MPFHYLLGMKSVFAPNYSRWAVNQGGLSQPPIVAGGGAGSNVVVDWERGEIRHRSGRRCKLSAREKTLLACLARRAGTPVSRDEILLQVWRLDPRRTATRTIDMHISFLRRKLDDDTDRPSVLMTVHGVGYMMQRGVVLSNDVPPATVTAEPVPWESMTMGLETLSPV